MKFGQILVYLIANIFLTWFWLNAKFEEATFEDDTFVVIDWLPDDFSN